jgi:hypothetical protein
MPNTYNAQDFGTDSEIVVNSAASGRHAPAVQPVPENYWRGFIERWENEGGAGANSSDRGP